MRIVIDAVGIRGHGGAAVLCELLHWLPIVRPDWFWHVFVFNCSFREFDDPVVSEKVTLEHVALGDSGWNRLKWVNRHLPARLRHLKADALFSFANIAPTVAIVPQIVFCHQHNAFCGESIPIRMLLQHVRLCFIRRFILRGAKASMALIVQTNAMCECIKHFEPNLKGRICVIPSGYRTLPVKPNIREQIRHAVDSASRPRLVYVSHPSEHKNHIALVRAMSVIVGREPAARLIFTLDRTRSGDNRYNRFVHRIQSEANRLGLAEHVVWLGQITPDEVDFTLRSCDLMVFPSLSESFGLGLVEAMAAGCPIAASDLPYAHDVAGEAALYFHPKQPGSIAETVDKVLHNADCRKIMQHAGAALQNRYRYETIAESIVGIIETAVGV